MESRGVVADASGPLAGLRASQIPAVDHDECDDPSGQQQEH